VVRDPWTADPVQVPIPGLEERCSLFRGGRALGLAPADQVRHFFGRPDWEHRLGADLAVIDTPPGGLIHILAAADMRTSCWFRSTRRRSDWKAGSKR
jgi:hypothetical protein